MPRRQGYNFLQYHSKVSKSERSTVSGGLCQPNYKRTEHRPNRRISETSWLLKVLKETAPYAYTYPRSAIQRYIMGYKIIQEFYSDCTFRPLTHLASNVQSYYCTNDLITSILGKHKKLHVLHHVGVTLLHRWPDYGVIQSIFRQAPST